MKLLIALFCLPVLFANASQPPSPGQDPSSALQQLKEGNARFVSGRNSHCGKEAAVRESLVEKQAPGAIVLSCSDSRVPPELVFDRNLGDLFAIRVAGNVLNDENVASIEYAIEHLGSRLIVVMGHESCGAVKAALSYSDSEGAESPSLGTLIAEIRTNMGARLTQYSKEKDAKLREPVKTNVSAVAASLLKRSRIVKEAVDSGRVKIVQAIYGLGTGRVEFWE
jgi:carbonic anhydrase